MYAGERRATVRRHSLELEPQRHLVARQVEGGREGTGDLLHCHRSLRAAVRVRVRVGVSDRVRVGVRARFKARVRVSGKNPPPSALP